MKLGLDTTQRQSVIKPVQVYWAPMIFAFGALMSLGWLDNARGPVYPLLLYDLGLSQTQGGWFFAVTSLVAVGSTFVVPFALHWITSRKLLFLGILFLGVFTVAFSQSHSYQMLIIAAIVFGIALGCVGAVQNIVVEESVPRRKRRQFLSLLHSFYGLAALSAPLSIVFLLDYKIPWNLCFYFVGIFLVPLMILGGFVIFKEKQYHFVSIERERGLRKKDKNLILFWGTVLFFYISSELFFASRLVIYYVEYLGLDLSLANINLALFFLGLFVGRLGVSFLPQTFKGQKLLIYSLSLSLVGLILGLLLFPQGLYLMGFFMAPVFPVSLSEIAEYSGSKFHKVSSLSIALGSLGVVFMHILTGYISDIFGLKVSFLIPLILISLALIRISYKFPSPHAAPSKL